MKKLLAILATLLSVAVLNAQVSVSVITDTNGVLLGKTSTNLFSKNIGLATKAGLLTNLDNTTGAHTLLQSPLLAGDLGNPSADEDYYVEAIDVDNGSAYRVESVTASAEI